MDGLIFQRFELECARKMNEKMRVRGREREKNDERDEVVRLQGLVRGRRPSIPGDECPLTFYTRS